MRIKIDPLDTLFSRFIRLRDEVCQYCGRGGRLETSHFHGRRKRSVRYDTDNACALCYSCHRFLGENPYAHTEFFRKRLGTEKFEALNIRAEMVFPKSDKEVIKASLKEKIKLLEGKDDLQNV